MIYRNIILKYNDEEFRLTRLKKVIDQIYEDSGYEASELIRKLEDDKGTLKVYWLCKITTFLINVVNSIWMDNYEFHTEHIIAIEDCDYCACCHAPPQKECEEVKNYFNLN
jgi:hypothetical protein